MRRNFIKGIAAASIAGIMAVSIPVTGWAQSAADFYKGKNIRWIIPYKPGGGYDEYSRLIAPYFEKYTGARVDLVNSPGAGGMKGVNELFISPPDGLTVGIINGSPMVTNELSEISGVKYKMSEFNFLGRVVADLRVLVTSTATEYDSIDKVLNSDKEIVLGATGLGGSTYVDAVLTSKAFGNKQKVVHGFGSSSDIRAAMLRGDVSGMWGSLGSAMEGVRDDEQQILLQSGEKRSAELPDVPTAVEIAEKLPDAANRLEILGAWAGLNDVGRPVAAPPGVPADRVAFLQKAFASVFKDAEFKAAAEKAGRELSYESGENMAKIAQKATKLSPENKAVVLSAIKKDI